MTDEGKLLSITMSDGTVVKAPDGVKIMSRAEYEAALIDRLHAALCEAVEWNWIDGDVPEDVYDRVHAVIDEINRAKGAE